MKYKRADHELLYLFVSKFFVFNRYPFIIKRMALVAPPTAFDERRISRKLTINIDQHEVNVRPIIKGMYSSFIVIPTTNLLSDM